jgi:hypothetical protein
VFYYPTKFGNPPTGLIPLATGVEARLIEAEAALAASQIGPWAAALNNLRATGEASPIPPLTADSTTLADSTMRVDVMFRERAFWLFGTGARLGDMRRLVRQYGRDPSAVFPKGVYAGGAVSGLPTYGTDVSLTLPTRQSGNTTPNPHYKGCLSNPSTP